MIYINETIVQCGKTRNLLSREKIFRENNLQWNVALNHLISRNFCEKVERDESKFFQISHCELASRDRPTKFHYFSSVYFYTIVCQRMLLKRVFLMLFFKWLNFYCKQWKNAEEYINMYYVVGRITTDIPYLE